MPSTTNSASARRERSSAWVRSRPVTISLAISESNAPGTVSPLDVAAVDADARAASAAATRDSVPGAGMKLLPASSALMRNSIEWPATVGVVVAERLAGGDPEHLAHQVEAGDLLGDRVLDLEPGVDLEEGDRAVLADEELAGAGADVAGLAEDRLGRRVERGSPARRRGTARAPPRRASGGGAAASSRGWRPPRRCRGGRPGTGSRRGAACRGTSRRSTRRGRTR